MTTIACIATGPSLTQADVDYVRGKARVLAISDAYRLAPWADWLYSADRQWWDHHIDAVRETRIIDRWTLDKGAAEAYGLNWVRSYPKHGLSADYTSINEGRNSGYQAINLARNFGARRIVLLGYDMQGTHFFGEHPAKFTVRNNFALFLPHFPALADGLAAEGVEVVNCTRTTALHAFRCARLEDTL